VGASLRAASRLASLVVATLCGALPLLPRVALADLSPDDRVVARVVDGDTLVLDGGEKVRLIGVDTPETVHPNKPVERFGKEASAFTKRMAEGKHVRLEYDQERRDRYGRTLAYVYLADGKLLNLELICHGYGFAYTRFQFSKMEEFRSAEREAREQERGYGRTRTGNLIRRLQMSRLVQPSRRLEKHRRLRAPAFLESSAARCAVERAITCPRA